MSGSIIISPDAVWSASSGVLAEVVSAIRREVPSSVSGVHAALDAAVTGILSLEDLDFGELRAVATTLDLARGQAITPAVEREFSLLVESINDDPRIAGPSEQMATGIFAAVTWRGPVGPRLAANWLHAPDALRPARWGVNDVAARDIVEVPIDASGGRWWAENRRSSWQYRDTTIGSELSLRVWPGDGVVPPHHVVGLIERAVQVDHPLSAAVHVLSRTERAEALAERRADVDRSLSPDRPQIDVLAGLRAGLLYWRWFTSNAAKLPAGLPGLHPAARGTWVQLTPEPPNDVRYPAYRAARDQAYAALAAQSDHAEDAAGE